MNATPEPTGLVTPELDPATPRTSAGASVPEPASELTPPPATFLAGYARVSRGDSQSLDRQLTELRALGCERIWTDELSGRVRGEERPGWASLMSALRPGDTLAVVEVSRVSRSLRDLLQLVDELTARGVTLRVPALGDLGGDSPTARLALSILGAVSELEVELTRARTVSGLAEARRRGVRMGRPEALDARGRATARAMREAGASNSEVAAALGVSVRTVQRACSG